MWMLCLGGGLSHALRIEVTKSISCSTFANTNIPGGHNYYWPKINSINYQMIT